MDQKDFDQLLERYLQGDVSEEERALIDRWYQAIEPTSSGITKTEKLIIEKRLQSVLKAYKEKTDENVERSRRGGQAFMLSSGLGWRIAASITCILAIAGVFILIPYSGDTTDVAVEAYKNEWKQIENTSSYVEVITLQDGSEITLEAGALLEYPERFDPLTREVRLRRGGAFFNVRRDRKRPFYVYSYDVVTRVLGTSFMINSDEKGHVTVDVKTGRVSVSARLPVIKGAKAPETILTPNQRAAYDPQHAKIIRTLVEKPAVIIPAEEVRDMTFDRASIGEIFHAVEKAYNVKIGFDEEKFASCVLTTHLIPDEDLYTRLKIICKAIGASYSVEDGNVIISGQGCQ